MKQPRSIRFSPEWTPLEAAQHVLAVRFAEALARSAALETEDDETHHAFRLACKRLRYAIERSEPQLLGLEETARWLSEMTDALGEAHDAVVLYAEAVKAAALRSAELLIESRADALRRARQTWKAAFAPAGRAEPLTHVIANSRETANPPLSPPCHPGQP